jgi:hypothetical protein
VSLHLVSDLVVITLSGIALVAGRPALQRWKSDVRRRAHMLSDPELERFLRSRSVKTFGWTWSAIVTAMLFIGVSDLLAHM